MIGNTDLRRWVHSAAQFLSVSFPRPGDRKRSGPGLPSRGAGDDRPRGWTDEIGPIRTRVGERVRFPRVERAGAGATCNVLSHPGRHPWRTRCASTSILPLLTRRSAPAPVQTNARAEAGSSGHHWRRSTRGPRSACPAGTGTVLPGIAAGVGGVCGVGCPFAADWNLEQRVGRGPDLHEIRMPPAVAKVIPGFGPITPIPPGHDIRLRRTSGSR